MLPEYLIGQPNLEWRFKSTRNSAWYHQRFGRYYLAAHLYRVAIRQAIHLVSSDTPVFKLTFEQVYA